MELLAPAGDLPCLEAAVEAGADAAYLGLSLLNARRGAKNFTPGELERAVELAHRHHVAVHLTLNIDVSKRETGAAARILAMARDFGVDAVIARDWGVAALWRAMADAAEARNEKYPALHLSTQSAVTNVEGARLAREIGVRRVVLAREMSLAEIREVSGIEDLEIEVFAQGALCYSISGRCLLSSWGGGKSGNRGLCASPCRVPWAVDGDGVGTAMSMRDLVTVDRLRELADAGVDALKIEGRLKKPEWIREAVTLYRQAIGPRDKSGRRPGAPMPGAAAKAQQLADYAGRDVTSSYLDGSFSGLTGKAARKSSRAAAEAIDEFLLEKADYEAERGAGSAGRDPVSGYSLEVTVTETGLSCHCSYLGKKESWRLPKTRIKREKKAVTLAELFEQLRHPPPGEPPLVTHYTNEPDFMLPPRNVKAMTANIASFTRRMTGNDRNIADSVLKAPLPDEMRPALAVPEPHPGNCRRLGERPTRIRLAVRQLNHKLATTFRGLGLVVVNAQPTDIEHILKCVPAEEVTIAFPEVYFPGESGEMAALAECCRALNLKAEANCWGSLWLCREFGLRFSAGPGLPILNHVAVKCLRDLGAESATVSMEADRAQIEEVTAASALPLTLLVYARPILAHTRIPRAELLPAAVGADAAHSADGAWTDRRGMSLSPESGRSTTFFRSLVAFDWKTIHNGNIRVADLAVDLSGESMPLESWKKYNQPGGKPGFLFNYDRGLK